MHRTLLRIVQVGLVLAILAALALGGATVLGLITRDAALVAARELALLIALAVGAGCALCFVIDLGRGADERKRP